MIALREKIMNNLDIVSIGELLVDFTGFSLEDGSSAYKLNAGGAPANVACMASKLGSKAGFIGKIGRDMFGFYLKSELLKNGIDTSGLIIDKNYKTTMAFVKNREDGERDFEFYREESWSADLNLRYGEVNREMIDSCRVLHFGSLCLTAEPARTAVLNSVEYAKSKGKLVSYDPNYRPLLWPNEEYAKSTIRSAIRFSDIIKVSEEELKLLTDCETMTLSIAKLFSEGVRVLCITQGAKGCIVATPRSIHAYPSFKVETVDTLGAGDSFFGGFLHKLCKTNKTLEELEQEDIAAMAMVGNACGALTSSKKGAIPAMPDAEQVQTLLDSYRTEEKKS